MCDSCRIAGRRCAPPWRGKESTAFDFMYNLKNNSNGLIETSSPILMVSAADLEEALRSILEEVVSASNGEKDETLLTVRQAASLLGVDRSTLWRWDKQGYLKPQRIGRRVRYPMYAVQAVLRGGEHE